MKGFETFSAHNKGRHDGEGRKCGIVGSCPDGKFARVTSKGENVLRMAEVPEGEREDYQIDTLTLLGGSKAFIDEETREFALLQLDELSKIHQAEWFLLVDHFDCSKWKLALKKSLMNDRQFHYNKLREAYAIIKDRLPHLQVILAYASPVDGDMVQFEHVTPTG